MAETKGEGGENSFTVHLHKTRFMESSDHVYISIFIDPLPPLLQRYSYDVSITTLFGTQQGGIVYTDVAM